MTSSSHTSTPFPADCTLASLRLLRPVPRWKPALRPSDMGLTPDKEVLTSSEEGSYLVAEEVTEVRAIAGQGLVGDYLFGHAASEAEPWGGCVLFSSMESWNARARRLEGVDVEQPSNVLLPRHILTEGVEWELVGTQSFQIGEVIFQPIARDVSTRLLRALDMQIRLPHWEAWGIFPGVVASVERSGWLRSERPVFCGCGA